MYNAVAMPVAFHRPYVVGREFAYIRDAYRRRHLSGDGPFTRRCQRWLEERVGCAQALLTHSGTGALDMAALLAGVGPGDEIILPSFTFPSTANAFALRGATLVFVDIRPDTLNLDETKIPAALTKRTKAIVPVHYAGVGCDMDAIGRIAGERGLLVIEDASHGVLAAYRGRELGSFGQMAVLSFHETKNLVCGEGGALLVNDPRLRRRAEVVSCMGTNRREFLRGQADRYTWQDLGSSFLPSDILAAGLWAQMEEAERIMGERRTLWERYHALCRPLEERGALRRPVVPPECRHNAHIYHILLPAPRDRDRLLAGCRRRGIGAGFHYIPLHSSPAGRRYGRASGRLEVTESASRRILRLPLWVGMRREPEAVARVLQELL